MTSLPPTRLALACALGAWLCVATACMATGPADGEAWLEAVLVFDG